MGVPHVTSFCCCMGLERGSIVIGVVHLLASLTLVVLCSVFAENTRAYIGTVEDAEDHLYTTWYKISVGVAVMSVVHVCLAAILLYSVSKRSTAGLRTWLYVMLALFSASILYTLVNVCVHGFNGTGSDIFLSFLEAILFFGLIAYCILTVYSYYLMLKSSEDMEGPNKTDY